MISNRVSVRTEWLNKHIEPSMLCDPAKSFFQDRGLSTKETVSKGKHRIEAFLAGAENMPFAIVEIYGNPSRILVDFSPWGKNERTAQTMLVSSILTLLGGGVLVRQGLKRRELMEHVENQFWDFLDSRVLELSR